MGKQHPKNGDYLVRDYLVRYYLVRDYLVRDYLVRDYLVALSSLVVFKAVTGFILNVA